MKLKHTQAKKARRASEFRKAGRSTAMSRKRWMERAHLRPVPPRTQGLQIIRTQRVFLRKDQFGAPVYKTIQHAAS